MCAAAAPPDTTAGVFPAGKRQAKVAIPAVWTVLECSEVFNDDCEEHLDLLVDAGATAVVLRDTQSGGGDLFNAAAHLKEMARGRVAVLVEDRADIASACSVDGVLLTARGSILNRVIQACLVQTIQALNYGASSPSQPS